MDKHTYTLKQGGTSPKAGKEAAEKVQPAATAAAMPAKTSRRCKLDNGIAQTFGEVSLQDLIYITQEERNQNYAHNMAQELTPDMVDKNGMIINQGVMTYFVINRYSVAYGGCGAIALYNTIKILDPDSEVTFPQIIYWIEPYGILNNALGIVPSGITSVLNDMGYKTQLCFFKNADKISELASEADAAVTLYINKSLSAHYVAFHAVGADESGQQKFKFYNEIYGAGDDTRTYLSFEQNHGIWDLEDAKKEYASKEAPGEAELFSIVILVTVHRAGKNGQK